LGRFTVVDLEDLDLLLFLPIPTMVTEDEDEERVNCAALSSSLLNIVFLVERDGDEEDDDLAVATSTTVSPTSFLDFFVAGCSRSPSRQR
jgi:hypothetical protein